MPDSGAGFPPEFSAGEWDQIKDLVYECQQQPPEDLDSWLRGRCSSDKLRREVLRLLRASGDCGTFLTHSASEDHLGIRLSTPMRIGKYRITGELGSGGSGMVYAAWDESLKRQVAVKVLRPEAAQVEELRRRLRWDARTASTVQHPNIVVIHEIGSDGNVDFVAMECISGQTLSRSIKSGGLEVRQVLHYAIQICRGLEAAHSAGIVHRDLKPGNIMINEQGVVKLLDFGLAKNAYEGAHAGPDTAAPETIEGRFAGTVAYVSPEQAECKPVDARSDIFSFGSVLYEMLTGRQAFPGTSTVSVLADVLHNDPRPAHEVAANADPRFDDIVRRCMRKDRERRFQSIADVRVRLEELEEQVLNPQSHPPVVPAKSRARWLFPAWGASMVVIAAMAAAVSYVLMRGPQPAEALAILSRITADRGISGYPALSRDAKFLAYASTRDGDGNLDIWVQHLENNDARRLTTNAADDYEPVFSPDGSRIVYRTDRDGGWLYSVSTLGGDERPIVSGGQEPQFSPDGNWILYWTGHEGQSYQPGSVQIWVLPAVGGPPERLMPDFPACAHPRWSPDGKHILFFGRGPGAGGKDGPIGYWLAPFHSQGAPHSIPLLTHLRQNYLNPIPGGSGPIAAGWLPDNTVFVPATRKDASNIWGIKLGADGDIQGGLSRLTAGTTREWHPSITMAGGRSYLAFESTSVNYDVWRVNLDSRAHAKGNPEQFISGFASVSTPSVSADGSRLVVSVRQQVQLARYSIRMVDLISGHRSIVEELPPPNAPFAVISGDGKTVAYLENKVGFVVPATGGSPQKVCDRCGPSTHISFDGRAVLFDSTRDPEQILLGTAGSKPKPLVELNAPRYTMQSGGRFSPDGHWVAFSAGNPREAAKQIFIAPFHPDRIVTSNELIQVTDDEASNIVPSFDTAGRTLFFLSSRDGHRCIWGQLLDKTMHPSGVAYLVAHFHHRNLLLGGAEEYAGAVGLFATPEYLVFAVTQSTSDVWLKTQAGPSR